MPQKHTPGAMSLNANSFTHTFINKSAILECDSVQFYLIFWNPYRPNEFCLRYWNVSIKENYGVAAIALFFVKLLLYPIYKRLSFYHSIKANSIYLYLHVSSNRPNMLVLSNVSYKLYVGTSHAEYHCAAP